MLDVITTIFWGLVLITVIVFIHEAGHYTAARAFGLRVKEFMIGLPGPKIGFKRKDTLYGVTAIPLGGYCQIAGMEKGEEGDEIEQALTFITYFGEISEDQAEEAGERMGFDLVRGLDTLADWGTVRRYKEKGLCHYTISGATIDDVQYKEGECRVIADQKEFLAQERKLTYTALPWWKRVVILFAGSFTNLVVAFAVIMVLLMVNGAAVNTTTIYSVEDGFPAAEAGLVSEDVLVSLNGVSFEDYAGFSQEMQNYAVGDEVELGYLHDGKEERATITLADNNGKPKLGVSIRTERQPVGFVQAAEASVQLIGSMFTTILQLFNPTTFASTISQSSGIVGITMEARSAADSGPVSFVLLTAVLSISIGFFNLLPIPPFDGGKIIIETIERITKRKLPAAVINGLSLAGIAAMLLLFIVVTNADIQRYFFGG